MKKLLLITALFFGAALSATAQETTLEIIGTDMPDTPKTRSTEAIEFGTEEQQPFQQLIGYAIEVSSTALAEQKPVGRYHCNRIYPIFGYSVLPKYPCQVIVHAAEGPIVVRYQNVTSEMNDEIDRFLKDNQMETSLRYNKGRFRFSLDEPEAEAEVNPASTKKADEQTNPDF